LNASTFLAQQINQGLNPLSDQFATELVDRLLPVATQCGASDVHLQPTSSGWKLRVRIDGVLSDVCDIAGGGVSDPVSRLMVLAGLPTYRCGSPMEGRLPVQGFQDSEQISMRLGVFPTVHGPRAVIRVLRRNTVFDTLSSLHFDLEVTAQLERLCQARDGAILLTGPAGSGKTTTLYTMLQRIASAVPRRSVLTIEDPVETTLSLISQSEIDVAAGMTLASALRSAVRQDSEVLLVSEIRDPETVEAAMQASLTGHLVFSSLHATDIATTLRRLVAYGVPSPVVRSGLRAVINQRLLRCLCPDCKAGIKAESSHACPTCQGTGYKGVRPLAQCVEFQGAEDNSVGDVLTDALEAGWSVAQMNAAAKKSGIRTLSEHASEWISTGITDLAEVYRVLGT
jgi:general secretion pathway protein E